MSWRNAIGLAMVSALLIAGVWAMAIPVGGLPGSECDPPEGAACFAQCDEQFGILGCWGFSSERCCWEGPSSCGESTSCSGCGECPEGGF